jgi:alpha-beta hydrolase superfamily lysophospholipase
MDVAEYTTGTIRAQDGIPLFYRLWNRDAAGGRTLFLVHGLGEHSGRYVHLGSYFAKAGYRSIAFDLRGHGRSGGKPVFVQRYEELADDVQSVVNHFGAKASFLFGHSMGGQLVLWTARRGGMNLAGLIASAPWLGLAEAPPRWQIFLAGLLNRHLPGFRFPTNVNSANLSHDQAHLDSLEDLDLVHYFITVRFYFEAIGAAQQTLDDPAIDCPVLLLQGSDDRVISRETVEAFYKRLRAPEKTLKIYPGLFHELHNETARLAVLHFFLEWMNTVSRLESLG